MGTVVRAIWISICLLSFLISVPVALSESLRSAYMSFMSRKWAWIWPQDYAFIGDSLTLNCSWRRITGRPLSTIVLAEGGRTIRQITSQVWLAHSLGARHLFINAGGNDILLLEQTDQIARDFDFLLRQIQGEQTAVVTLIPYVSDVAMAPSITAANAVIADLARRRGFPVIDLNPILASDGVRRPEMTNDGIHLTQQACIVWNDAVRAQIANIVTR